MRNRVVWFSLLTVLVFPVALFLGGCKQSAPQRVKIGVILPLTGNVAKIGEDLQKGMDVAYSLYRDSVRYKVDLVYKDSQGDPQKGVSAFRLLLFESPQPLGVIVALSTVTKALIPIADREKIPLIATATSAAGLPQESEWVFRFFTQACADAKAMAEFAVDSLGIKKVSILALQNEFGQSYAACFKRYFERKGGKIQTIEYYPPGETQFGPYVLKILRDTPDAVYLVGYTSSLPLIPRKIRELGKEVMILGPGTIGEPWVIEQAGGSLEGAYYTGNLFDVQDTSQIPVRDFVRAFSERYQGPPQYFNVFGYDLVRMLMKTIDQLPPTQLTREGLKETLLSIRSFNGVLGTIRVQPDGEINFPVTIEYVKDGEPAGPVAVYFLEEDRVGGAP